MESEKINAKLTTACVFPEQLSVPWRMTHCTLYVIGGVTFFVGSFYFFPGYQNFLDGAWWYIVGSIAFFFADIGEWWTNNRIGCFCSNAYLEQYETYCLENSYPDKNTTWGKFRRMEAGLNYFLSATGSALYIAGSTLLIPALAINDGNILYIFASLVIMIAQSWKIYRQGRNNYKSTHFHIDYFQRDVAGLCVDCCAWLGAFGYFAGSIYFLTVDDVDMEDSILGAIFFVFGGAFFALSGICMGVRYFVTNTFV